MSSAVAVPGNLLDGSLHEGVQALTESDRKLGKPARKDLYIPSLDGVRAIAFLMVFVAHAGLEGLVPGGLGVTIFFFLSGYLITTLLRAEALRTETISLSDFYLRRVFRIMPPMYITLAIMYVAGFAGVLQQGNLLGFLSVSAYFFNYADLLHKHVVLPSGAGVLWSLMVEEHFYLIFPCVYLLFLHRRVSTQKQVDILLACCAAALLWRCVLIYHFHTSTVTDFFPRWTYSASDARFDAILFGCILAIRNNFSLGDCSPRLNRYKGLFAVAGLATIFASLVYREPHFRETFRYTVQSISLYPIFYYCISSASEWQVRWLDWKPLRFLGWVSYSMYLSHFAFLIVGLKLYPTHRALVAVASFCAALLYSWVMRIWVEVPSKGWRHSLERRLFAKA
jgi:peptidoglycan/LPS O-acetylase OafA/YrhL